jgi:hypothetical protein
MRLNDGCANKRKKEPKNKRTRRRRNRVPG